MVYVWIAWDSMKTANTTSWMDDDHFIYIDHRTSLAIRDHHITFMLFNVNLDPGTPSLRTKIRGSFLIAKHPKHMFFFVLFFSKLISTSLVAAVVAAAALGSGLGEQG